MHINFRCTAQERAALDLVSRRTGKSISDLIRGCLAPLLQPCINEAVEAAIPRNTRHTDINALVIAILREMCAQAEAKRLKQKLDALSADGVSG